MGVSLITDIMYLPGVGPKKAPVLCNETPNLKTTMLCLVRRILLTSIPIIAWPIIFEKPKFSLTLSLMIK